MCRLRIFTLAIWIIDAANERADVSRKEDVGAKGLEDFHIMHIDVDVN